MAVLYALLVLAILTHIGLRPCLAQCLDPQSFTCSVGVINMTSDGAAKLRRTIDSDVEAFWMVLTIDKLIVSSSGSGPFLQRIAGFTDQITYLVYREPVFQIPEGNTLSDIDIYNAGSLRSLVAGTNRHLKQLSVETCMLDRVPPTLAQMIALENLNIQNCALTALRMDVFANNPNLSIISLSRHQIRQIFPFTSPPKQRLIVAHLDLVANQLDRLDMAAFVHMPDLERLDVRGNRILRVEATSPATYESLLRLSITFNKISSIDLRNLTLPSLRSFYLDDNELTQIPTVLGRMPQLRYFGIDRNNLTQLDMSVFRRFENLSAIFVNENNIESIRTSSPVTLPLLDLLTFENNQIASVNFTGCNFPSMHLVSFLNNKLTAVPPLFQRFNSTRMSVEWNPIRCANLATFRARFVGGRLYASTGKTQSDCLTSSMIELTENVKGCCVA